MSLAKSGWQLSPQPNDRDAKRAPRSGPLPTLTERIQAIRGDRSIGQFARDVGDHRENIRRVLAGQAPSVGLAKRICEREGISADWLLFGLGPRNRSAMAASESPRPSRAPGVPTRSRSRRSVSPSPSRRSETP